MIKNYCGVNDHKQHSNFQILLTVFSQYLDWITSVTDLDFGNHTLAKDKKTKLLYKHFLSKWLIIILT